MALKHEEVTRLSKLFHSLEEREPLLCAWRYHCNSPKLSFKKKVITTLADLKKKGASCFTPLRSPEPGQVVILLLRDSPATSGMLIPIMKSLSQRNKPAFLIANRNTQHYIKYGMHSGYVMVNQLLCSVLNGNETSKIERSAREYEKEMLEISGSNRFENAKDWIRMGLTAKEVSNRFLDTKSYLLADADIGAFDKGLLLGAATKGINSAILQHGFFDEHNFPVHSKYVFDWGPYFTRQAELLGHPADRSVSLGSPRFDQLETIKSRPKDKNFASKHGVSGKPVVLAISNTHAYDVFHEHIDSYFASIGKLLDNNISLLVRLHPAEVDTALYEKHLGKERTKKIVFISARENLYDIMNNCDVVYHTLSSAAMEGMLLGIPVLWEQAPEKRAYMEPPTKGGGILVNSGNIVDIVNDVGRDGEERNEILSSQEEFLSISVVNRGRAADAIAEYMLLNI